MTSETPDFERLAPWLDALVDRLDQLDAQVQGLVTSQKVEARELVLKDDRAEIRARLEMEGYTPCLVFYDRLGKERLRIGLHEDGSPSILAEGREVPLPGV